MTALVAVYAAGVNVLASNGLLDRFGQTWRFLVPILFGYGIALLFIRLQLPRARELGRTVIAWRDPNTDRWHLALLAFFVGWVVYCCVNQSQFLPAMLVIPLAFHVVRELAGRLRIAEGGVAVVSGSFGQKHYQFLVDDQAGRLHAVPKRGAQPCRWPRAVTIKIPVEQAEAIQAILTEKQATTDDTAST